MGFPFYFLDESWGFLWIALTAFWIWMIVDCVRNEPRSALWLWIVVLLGFIGALVYFAARKLPNMKTPWAEAAARRQLIQELELQVRHLENAYYLTKLGDAYVEARMFDRALPRFEQALHHEPENLGALLGAGECLAALGNHSNAAPLLEKAYAKDPKYRMGRSAEVLAECYLELEQDEKLREMLTRLPRSTHQADYLRAYLTSREGKKDEARSMLQRLIDDIRHLPRANYRADKAWIGRAKRLLKSLAVLVLLSGCLPSVELQPAARWPAQDDAFAVTTLVVADDPHSARACSGTIVHSSGKHGTYVLTACHCVRRTQRIECIVHQSAVQGPPPEELRTAPEYFAIEMEDVSPPGAPGDVALLRTKKPVSLRAAPFYADGLDALDNAPLKIVSFDALEGHPYALPCRGSKFGWYVYAKRQIYQGQSGSGVFFDGRFVGVLRAAQDPNTYGSAKAVLVPGSEIAEWLKDRGLGFIGKE